jgi:DNA mismatch endonuclease (patch repair protein)
MRYRCDAGDLPGRPDLVFRQAHVVVFCDGDFWHGRDLPARLTKLQRGHNARYWVAKIEGNVVRDQRNNADLAESGWKVLRFWESDIARNADLIANKIIATVRAGLAQT